MNFDLPAIGSEPVKYSFWKSINSNAVRRAMSEAGAQACGMLRSVRLDARFSLMALGKEPGLGLGTHRNNAAGKTRSERDLHRSQLVFSS